MKHFRIILLLLFCVFSFAITVNPVYADSREVAFKKFLKKMQKDYASGKEVGLACVPYGCASVCYYYIDLDNDGTKELIVDEAVKQLYYIGNKIYTYKNGKVKRFYDKKNGFQLFAHIVYKVKGTKDFITESRLSGAEFKYSYCKYKKGEYYIDEPEQWERNIKSSYIYKKYNLKGKLIKVDNKQIYNLVYVKYKDCDPDKITGYTLGKIVVD